MIYLMVFAGSLWLHTYQFVSLGACEKGAVVMQQYGAQAYCVKGGEE